MVKGTLRSIIDFLRKEDGPTAVEYAVMLALIVVVCIAAITSIGTATNTVYNNAILKSAFKADPEAEPEATNGTNPMVPTVDPWGFFCADDHGKRNHAQPELRWRFRCEVV